MKTVISSKGQIVIPAEIRDQDQIIAGQKFEVERLESGKYLLKRQDPEINEGLMDWLLSCPEKDWFQPISSESTETV